MIHSFKKPDHHSMNNILSISMAGYAAYEMYSNFHEHLELTQKIAEFICKITQKLNSTPPTEENECSALVREKYTTEITIAGIFCIITTYLIYEKITKKTDQDFTELKSKMLGELKAEAPQKFKQRIMVRQIKTGNALEGFNRKKLLKEVKRLNPTTRPSINTQLSNSKAPLTQQTSSIETPIRREPSPVAENTHPLDQETSFLDSSIQTPNKRPSTKINRITGFPSSLL